ncbi:hypothetical protein J7337_011286 [Fusarium musae]|uniref:Transcription factor domain-containing protein n=1 Tax=Fusarium musae TaxID=1042133 RepID=A0A9P8D711_9HYPO|nr:hypothetical protein J7337_011286 [Fusarium musae]KAG9496510.1 hypothetical protein J7337_011286 [Fusarium musae]
MLYQHLFNFLEYSLDQFYTTISIFSVDISTFLKDHFNCLIIDKYVVYSKFRRTMRLRGAGVKSTLSLDSMVSMVSHAEKHSISQYQGPKGRLFVSAKERERILGQISLFPNCMPNDFILPSWYALSRFIAAYFNVFHEHYPFPHLPTLDEEPAVYEALSIRSVLDSLIRDDELKHAQESSSSNWKDWVKYESLERTKLIVFCFFNIHTIVFDLPLMMLSGELHSDHPCSEHKWKTASETLWREVSNGLTPPQDFQTAFEQLFIARGDESYSICSAGFSSPGGFILIHAVIQRIWLVRNATIPGQQYQQLSLERMNSFERALKAWSICWESNDESSMNPLSPNGPL